MLIMQNWDISGTWIILQMLLPILYLHNMRYQTDPMTQIEEKWLRSLIVSILDIFWQLIMLIMQNWDFSGTWILLQMLLPILYLHNMWYQTDSMSQIEKKWLRSRKVSILDIFWRLIMLIMQNWDFSGTWILLQMLLPILYLHNICDIRPIRWLKLKKSGLEVKNSRFWTYFDI